MASRIEALKFTREDKSELTIVVAIMEYSEKLHYRIDDIYIREFRKKNKISIKNKYRDNYAFRKLDVIEREKYVRKFILDYVTEEQIKQAINNAWEICKPNILSIDDIEMAIQ
jgi:hypothetical protein